MNSKKYIALATATLISLTSLQSVFAATVDNTVTLTTTVNDVLTATTSSATVALGATTPGTPTTGTVTVQVVTNAQAGFDVLVRRTTVAAATLLHTDATTTIADKTAWISTTPNAALWTGTGLGFRVNATATTAASRNATWWGSDDLIANALFAGLPGAYDTIYDGTGYASTQQDVALGFRLDVPGTQKSGSYSGTMSVRVQTAI